MTSDYAVKPTKLLVPRLLNAALGVRLSAGAGFWRPK